MHKHLNWILDKQLENISTSNSSEHQPLLSAWVHSPKTWPSQSWTGLWGLWTVNRTGNRAGNRTGNRTGNSKDSTTTQYRYAQILFVVNWPGKEGAWGTHRNTQWLPLHLCSRFYSWTRISLTQLCPVVKKNPCNNTHDIMLTSSTTKSSLLQSAPSFSF